MPNRSVLPSPAQAHLELAGLQDAVEFEKQLVSIQMPARCGGISKRTNRRADKSGGCYCTRLMISLENNAR